MKAILTITQEISIQDPTDIALDECTYSRESIGITIEDEELGRLVAKTGSHIEAYGNSLGGLFDQVKEKLVLHDFLPNPEDEEDTE